MVNGQTCVEQTLEATVLQFRLGRSHSGESPREELESYLSTRAALDPSRPDQVTRRLDDFDQYRSLAVIPGGEAIGRRMHAPLQRSTRQVREDHRGARQVLCTRDHFHRAPPVRVENGCGVTGILNSIERLRLLKNHGSGYALRLCDASHDFRFHEAIVCRAAGDDKPGCDSALVLKHALMNAILQPRRRITVAVRRSTEHHDRVEPLPICIGSRRNHACNCGPKQKSRQRTSTHENDSTNQPKTAALR
jgi:hypothetical protein